VVVESDSPDGKIWTVAFHPDGIHFYGGTSDGVRRWRVADGQEVGKQMGMDMSAISVSRDGKWIVCGTTGGTSVWDAELLRKVAEVEDTIYVAAVDVSPESTRFATGTSAEKASIWSISTGERLHCGYWIHLISAENPVNPRIHWIFPLKECPINFSDSLNVFFSQLIQ
jgi:WD40 repeat protein